ncbi:MAG: THUMP domain-containing class I SAM-dependent RNA methyltransferase [Ilumatobacteraceae bacterium]
MSERIDAFVVAAPGLEPLVHDEVVRLGVRPARVVHGGVECTVTWRQLWAMNLRLRIATRVVVRVARFRADGFGTLEAGLRRVDWSRWLPDAPVDVRASCDRASGLFHSGAVAERVGASLQRPIVDRRASATDPTVVGDDAHDGDDTTDDAVQSVLVRVVDDVVTVSLDSSGASLHHRGWRGPTGRAPVRETLAAALLVASGWNRTTPLVDPFCGSGTVLVEAAMMARRMAPGRQRSFACRHWPTFDDAAWQRLLDGVDADVIDRCPPIVGSDRDAGAVRAALANIEMAGLADRIEVLERPASAIEPPPGGRTGWVVSNPPYGERIGGGRSLVPLYDAFGRALAERFESWRVALLVADRVPIGAMGMQWSTVCSTTNGGIPVRVDVATR